MLTKNKIGLSVGGALFGVSTLLGALLLPGAESASNKEGWSLPVAVEVDATNAVAVCPPGVVDPTEKDKVSEQGPGWRSANATALEGGGSSFRVDADAQHRMGGHVNGQKQGDLLSFLVEGCLMPTVVSAQVVGGTEAGEDLLLVVANPYPQPQNVSVSALTQSGEATGVPTELVIPAETTQTFLPATWIGAADEVAIRLEAQGGGVASWMQSSGLDGEVPQGLGRAPLTGPSEQQTIPGLDPSDAGTLRVANFSAEPIDVEVSAVGKEGTQTLGGLEKVRIPGQGVTSVSLGKLPGGSQAITLEADEPFTASVEQRIKGKKHEKQDRQKTTSRTLIYAGEPTTKAEIPTYQNLGKAAQDLEFLDPAITLDLVNLNADPAQVTVYGEEIEVAAGALKSIPVENEHSAEESTFVSDQPLHAALNVTVDTPAGPVKTVLNLGNESILSQSRTVSLLPEWG